MEEVFYPQNDGEISGSITQPGLSRLWNVIQ